MYQETNASFSRRAFISNRSLLQHPLGMCLLAVWSKDWRDGIVGDTIPAFPAEQESLNSVVTVVFWVCIRRMHHKAKASLSMRSYSVFPLWFTMERKFVAYFLWTPYFNGAYSIWEATPEGNSQMTIVYSFESFQNCDFQWVPLCVWLRKYNYNQILQGTF